jgi:hypothetical protein
LSSLTLTTLTLCSLCSLSGSHLRTFFTNGGLHPGILYHSHTVTLVIFGVIVTRTVAVSQQGLGLVAANELMFVPVTHFVKWLVLS